MENNGSALTDKKTEKKLALFFFFIFLDDRLAARATAKAIDELEKKKKKAKSASLPDSELIQLAMQTFRHTTRHQPVTHSATPIEAWQIPKSVDMGPWRQFRKQVEMEEVMTLVWSQILEMNPEAIAMGMNVSEGTVRYRLAAGLKFLGTMAPLGGLRG